MNYGRILITGRPRATYQKTKNIFTIIFYSSFKRVTFNCNIREEKAVKMIMMVAKIPFT